MNKKSDKQKMLEILTAIPQGKVDLKIYAIERISK